MFLYFRAHLSRAIRVHNLVPPFLRLWDQQEGLTSLPPLNTTYHLLVHDLFASPRMQ